MRQVIIILFCILFAAPALAGNSQVDALVETALLAKRAGKLDAALSTLHTALQMDGRHVGALLALGRTYGAKQDFDNAAKFLKKAIVIDPKSVDAQRFLALTYLRQGKGKEALAAANAALAIDKSRWETYHLLSEIHVATGNYDAAEKSLKKVLKLNPKSVEGNMGLALTSR
ncbi:MAG: tetratricopeptide (TPR) repeat protein, partial [Myxococcota bacterium]